MGTRSPWWLVPLGPGLPGVAIPLQTLRSWIQACLDPGFKPLPEALPLEALGMDPILLTYFFFFFLLPTLTGPGLPLSLAQVWGWWECILVPGPPNPKLPESLITACPQPCSHALLVTQEALKVFPT